ncbi:aminotransferase class III-fold pyridoxal phosphate-dependent enzyme, partial [Nocardia sp.]
YGLPMALVLFKPELDQWAPGEHNGTFRGNNPAFVTAHTALQHYWSDDALQISTETKGARIAGALGEVAEHFPGISTRGRGFVQGIVFEDPSQAGKVCQVAFERGLLVETSGSSDEVVKLLPPLTVTDDEVDRGLQVLTGAIDTVCTGWGRLHHRGTVEGGARA